METINRGDIYMVDFNYKLGSEQAGIRPAIILQNNKGNAYSKTIMVAPITTAKKQHLPTHIIIFLTSGVKQPSVALYEQITTIDKLRLIRKIGHKEMNEWDDRAIAISFGCASFLNDKDKEKINVESI